MQKMQWCRRSRTGLGRGELRLIRPQIGNPGEHVRAAPFALALALALTGCATTPEPQIVVKEVRVPVPVPCPIDTTEPTYVADKQSLIKAAKRGADAAVALLLGEIGQRKAWAEGVKRQAVSCRPDELQPSPR